MGSLGTCISNVAAPGRARAAFLHGLVDGMRCGVLAVHRGGEIVLINEIGRTALQLEEGVRAGDDYRTALATHPQLVGLLRESFDAEQLPNRAEIPLNSDRANGRKLGFTMSHVEDDAGVVVGTAMFFKDLTPIEHREEQERLQERLAAVGQMAASLAHEIRNPLASIGVSCKLVGRRLAAAGESTELVERISAELQRLNHTVSSCLEFVRPVTLQFRDATVEPLLRQAIAVAVERVRPRDVRVDTDLGDDLPPLRMDVTQLRQVFENLILNALEAVGPTGTILIEAGRVPASSSPCVPYTRSPVAGRRRSEADEFLVIRVSDDGPGVPEADRESIFSPFFTTKPQGSGVGLSMVRKIVDSHDGGIAVDRSRLGGARFTVRLPLVTTDHEESHR